MKNHKSTQLILYDLYIHIYFILTRKVEMLHKITSTIFLFILLLDMYTFYQHSTFSLLAVNKEGPKGKGTVNFLLSLSFWVIIFSIIGWLVEGSTEVKKAYYRELLGHLCFLDCHCFLFAFEASSSSKGKCALSDLSGPLLT